MKFKLPSILLIIILPFISHAQNSISINEGFGYNVSADKFNYDGENVGNYSIGWYDDSWNSTGSTAYLSGFGGVKFFTQSQLRLVMTPEDGFLGVGTDSPDALLHVRKGSTGHSWSPILGTVGIFESNDASRAFLTILGKSNGQSELWFADEDNQASGRVRYDHVNDHLVLYTAHNSNNNLMIDKNGQVGIGTYQPDAALTVNGKIHSKEVKVDLNIPAPDYVFAPEYELPSLSFIEQYIKENQHLPEVPSAIEMEEEGVEVGEMNMILLKKVEELTLHIIELEKRIKELERSDD